MSELRTERKVVTVLFADLVGFTRRSEELDPEDVAAILRPYHERLRAELERFGGTVEKFIGDAVMALFGAPVAHEDDPERAVRAALAIRDWAREEDSVQVRIAVNTGEALINLAARPESGEGMAAGDVVNTTARLQSAAPVNGVLVGETTQRATKHVIAYRGADPVEAKGKSESLPVWEAIEARARVGSEAVTTETPLVGRARELDQLVDALTRARQEPSAQLVTLVGVPGIGKSRLVHELMQVVEADPEIILWRHGRSLAYGEGVTFWALAEMVKAQAGILENDSIDAARNKLAAAVSDIVGEGERDWIETNLRPLVGVGGAEELGGDRRSESFAAWRRFFEALAETRPLVLVFEDLHWADDDVLDFVDELVDWIEDEPLLVVCTARPELLDRRPNWGGGKRNAVTISLTPLDDTETARLISGLLDRAVLPAETQTALLARAGGNPLYAEQFVRMVMERGETDGDVPETVHGVIAARLDALGEEEKALIQDASVVGKTFWPNALAHMGASDLGRVDGCLRTLARREFVRRERRGAIAGETEYSFGHLLVRDVAYNQIPRAVRSEKHRLAAAWIESLASDRSEDRAEMLAHHYLAAIELADAAGLDTAALIEPARLALREAAERASALGSYRQAIRLYSAALDLWPEDDADAPLLVLRRAHVQYELGDVPEVDDVIAAAEQLAASDRMDFAAEAESLVARIAWTYGHAGLAQEHGDRALELARNLSASPTKATVLIEGARLQMLAGRFDASNDAAREGLAMAEELGLERLQANALITLGTPTSTQSGDLLERGLELARANNDVQQIQRGYNNLGEELARRGDVIAIGPLYEQQRRSIGRLVGPGIASWMDAQHARYAYFLGEWGPAEPLLDRFVAELESGAERYMEPYVRFVRAHMRYARDSVDAAFREAEAGEAATRAGTDPQVTANLALYATLLLRHGDSARASALIDEVIATAFFDYYFLFDFGLALAELGRGDELNAIVAGANLAKPWAEIGRALAAGDFTRAADGYAGLGVRTYEAHARTRAAEGLVEAGRRPEADAQLRQALAFWHSVAASRYIREGEALLAATA